MNARNRTAQPWFDPSMLFIMHACGAIYIYVYIYNYVATFWENPVKGNEAN